MKNYWLTEVHAFIPATFTGAQGEEFKLAVD